MIWRTMSGRQVVQHRAFGALCQREGQRDEDDQTGIEKRRHGHHQAGDAQCPCSFFVTELPHHGHSQRLRAFGFSAQKLIPVQRR